MFVIFRGEWVHLSVHVPVHYLVGPVHNHFLRLSRQPPCFRFQHPELRGYEPLKRCYFIANFGIEVKNEKDTAILEVKTISHLRYVILETYKIKNCSNSDLVWAAETERRALKTDVTRVKPVQCYIVFVFHLTLNEIADISVIIIVSCSTELCSEVGSQY